MADLVTIAVHFGRRDNYPLLENLLKSFLVCNEYPNIELMLIESGGDGGIREWLSSLEFSEAFVNFCGSRSSITKDPRVSVSKETLFLDFAEQDPWFYCYLESYKRAIKEASGKYFVFFAEDNQFILKGDVISDYIEILRLHGEDRTIVTFCAQQERKYYKHNNRFGKPVELKRNLYAFRPVERKGDPFALCSRAIHETIGELSPTLLDRTIRQRKHATRASDHF